MQLRHTSQINYLTQGSHFMMNVNSLIEQYQLEPHPEGGYFKEIYRSDMQVTSPIDGETRSAVTHIYFLLPRGEVSRFHKVTHDEIWNYYAGAPLCLIDMDASDTTSPQVTQQYIGVGKPDFTYVIQGGRYQAAESTGEFTLVGCTVAPGFDFKDFSFIEDEQLKQTIDSTLGHLKKFV